MPYAKRTASRSRSRAPARRPAKRTKRVGGSSRKSFAPVAIGTSNRATAMSNHKMVQVSDTCTRIYGRSYLGNVDNNIVAGNQVVALGPPEVVAGANGNEYGLVFDINPTLLGDRVAVMAGTYDKYVYQSMKFTYTPQCSSTQVGSVVLAFERDPQGILANTASTKYMQEIMSYEHAVLTPAWQPTSVTYKRDPQEMKTWFMSGDQATVSTRETSQGVLLAYVSQTGVAPANLGFITIDYVLDFIAPNIMPSKAVPVQPEQFRKSSYECFGTFIQAADNNSCWFTFAGSNSDQAKFNSGDIIEAVYAGPEPCAGFKSIIDGSFTTANINPGDKLYLAIGNQLDGNKKGLVFTNLAHALGAPSRYGTNVVGALEVLPTGALLPTNNGTNVNPFTGQQVSSAAGLQKKRYLYFRKIVEGGQIDTSS